jgi:hypothetical protein
MATENVLSGAITNRDATPKVLNTAQGGVVRRAWGTAEAAAAGDAGSTYRLCSIPSNARAIRVVLATDDLGTTATLDVGLYQTTENGSAVVDADFFASAVNANTAAVAETMVSHESGVYGVEDIEKPLWEALGLSADSQRDYDVVVTSAGDIDQAGTITLIVDYVQ